MWKLFLPHPVQVSTLSDQAQATLQIRCSLPDLVSRFSSLKGKGAIEFFHRRQNPLSAAQDGKIQMVNVSTCDRPSSETRGIIVIVFATQIFSFGRNLTVLHAQSPTPKPTRTHLHQHTHLHPTIIHTLTHTHTHTCQHPHTYKNATAKATKTHPQTYTHIHTCTQLHPQEQTPAPTHKPT